MGIKIFIFI